MKCGLWVVGFKTSYLLTNIYSHMEQTVGRQWTDTKPSQTGATVWLIHSLPSLSLSLPSLSLFLYLSFSPSYLTTCSVFVQCRVGNILFQLKLRACTCTPSQSVSHLVSQSISQFVTQLGNFVPCAGKCLPETNMWRRWSARSTNKYNISTMLINWCRLKRQKHLKVCNDICNLVLPQKLQQHFSILYY